MPLRVILRASGDMAQAFVTGDTTPINRVSQLWKAEGRELTETIMKQIVPVRTGYLRDSITSRETDRGFSVYPTAPYSTFVNKDTRAHMIFPRKANGVLRWFDSSGIAIFAKYVSHPGTTGQHFIEATRDSAKPLLRNLYREIWKR